MSGEINPRDLIALSTLRRVFSGRKFSTADAMMELDSSIFSSSILDKLHRAKLIMHTGAAWYIKEEGRSHAKR